MIDLHCLYKYCVVLGRINTEKYSSLKSTLYHLSMFAFFLSRLLILWLRSKKGTKESLMITYHLLASLLTLVIVVISLVLLFNIGSLWFWIMWLWITKICLSILLVKWVLDSYPWKVMYLIVTLLTSQLFTLQMIINFLHWWFFVCMLELTIY